MIQIPKVAFYTIAIWQVVNPVNGSNLPLDVDLPEEVLRAEIITEARSPIDGTALSASDFAELVVNTKQQLERDNASLAAGNDKLRETLLLLRLRSFLRSVGVPIK